jgi:hypothetical protein
MYIDIHQFIKIVTDGFGQSVIDGVNCKFESSDGERNKNVFDAL